MPQFDISTFSSQIFWFGLCFITLYYFASAIILPRIRDILEERKNAIDSDITSTQSLENDIEKINKETALLRQKATDSYQEKLDQATQEAAAKKEELIEEVKNKIDVISKKSQDDLEKFIASTKDQSQSAAKELAQNIRSKLFNIS